MKGLLKVNEVSELFGLSPEFIYKKAEAGDIPVYRFGRALRFDPEELRAWARTQNATKDDQGQSGTARTSTVATSTSKPKTI